MLDPVALGPIGQRGAPRFDARPFCRRNGHFTITAVRYRLETGGHSASFAFAVERSPPVAGRPANGHAHHAACCVGDGKGERRLHSGMIGRTGPVFRGAGELCSNESTWYPRRDSNLGLRLRRPTLYPLSYGGNPFGSVPRRPAWRIGETLPLTLAGAASSLRRT